MASKQLACGFLHILWGAREMNKLLEKWQNDGLVLSTCGWVSMEI